MYTIKSSESVSPGHPDKIADMISDAILTEVLKQDCNSRCAIETFIKNSLVIVGGELDTKSWLNIEKIVKNVIFEIGYNNSKYGFDYNSCSIISMISEQSSDIRVAVDNHGAGDQGIVTGYACDETSNFLPLTVNLAHDLMRTHYNLRRQLDFDWLGPDAKSQVSIRYINGKAISLDNIILSTQHLINTDLEQVKQQVIDNIILSTIPENLLGNDTKIIVNPAGAFTIGGPIADTGLTGRKLMVDTYGTIARHGGGAFSGKDPTKVDRSGAYMARYLAKNIVATGLAQRCEVDLSYAIGIAQPTSIEINTFDDKINIDKIKKYIINNIDLTPSGIIDHFQLRAIDYKDTVNFGHFGKNNLPWEKVDFNDI